ncbi:DUF736 family protein [Paracoccus versutus]|uniref:Uncharacterized protein DUF736 n=1 Tax=Paracoccus versutus TaxID=34007 RepID=A0A369TUY7_PARVE|nr:MULTISPECIES: DUF736 family protein [Paracoccus]MBT0779132.1 DUF736 family protein [Paracoccus sp. pheM1]RDD69053.1 DUF736 family protein [Paracoccus versutus]REF68494.1 uncharacterized protein DUF736 [Paracoccus versutus]WEJ77454.1 DUF736 family protein [Paracoccus versutus]WGR56687.1 DUF736 family protein [Paracoccus versutus]
MPQIGQFTRGKSGFAGRVQTLTLAFDLAIRPASSPTR